MKKFLLSLTCLVTASMAWSQEPQFEWARHIDGRDGDEGKAIFVDGSGNVYTTGYFSGEVDFDPGNNAFYLNAVGDADVFVSKLDADGNFVWAKAIGGSGAEVGRAIVVDVVGNVYIAGNFSGTVDFDPDTFDYNLKAFGTDIFISKLDANGVFLWAKQIGGNETDNVSSMTIDGFGNLYLTGAFIKGVDFDPGPGISILTAHFDKFDMYVVKLKSNGSLVWARSMGSLEWDEGFAVATDDAGNVYTTGYFQGTADFDPGIGVANITAAGDDDIFISKLDSAGKFVWVKKIGGKFRDNGISLVMRGNENLYLAGFFQDSVDFDPGTGISDIRSLGSGDIFISKFDTAGNFVWVKRLGGSINDVLASIAADDAGSVYAIGNFSETADFDPGPDTFNLTSRGGTDLYIAKLDASGNFAWARRIGGPSYEYGSSVKVDLSGNIYTVGYFAGTADFNPGSDSFFLTSAGSYDIFVLKMKTKTGGAANQLGLIDISVYPNPASTVLTIRNNADNEKLNVQLFDISGKVILSENLILNENTLDISELSDGLYVIRIIGETGVFNGKLLVKH